jgi:hypothetical protein
MEVRIVKNTWTSPSNPDLDLDQPSKKGWYGWVVVDENIEPIHLPSCPFKTKKNAIKAIESGRFESYGVTRIIKTSRIPKGLV